MPESTRPSITRTPFVPVAAPETIALWFCPACGRMVTGSYNIDPAKKKCTKTWHLTTARRANYQRAGDES